MPADSLSVVIPTWQEEDHLPRCLAALRADPALDEILVVDGGSTDRTRELAVASPGVRLIVTARGRGVQMNAGAAAARGGLLWFLHADCVPPPGAGAAIRRVLAEPGVAAGAFRFRVAAPGLGYRGLELGVRVRSEILGLPYGDQGLFMKKEGFLAAGGYPERERLEDLLLVRRLRRAGRVWVVPLDLGCSPRRWEREGLVATTLANAAWLTAALAGLAGD